MAQVLWSGRLEEKPEAEAFAFESSILVDARMALDDVRGSRAHAAMLGACGIIPADAAAKLYAALADMARELEAGTLAVDADVEDVHSFIEGVLTERLGDLGRMVHAGATTRWPWTCAFTSSASFPGCAPSSSRLSRLCWTGPKSTRTR